MGDSEKSPAVAVGKERANGDGIVMLSTGIRARLKPVAASLINEVNTRVKDPPVPMWNNPDKPTDAHPEGRLEPNPFDPIYVEAKSAAAQERSTAALDALILFGVELVDGVPEDDSWLKKLQYLVKRGQISLESYDLTDDFEREFVFKKYIAVGTDDLSMVGALMGLSEEAVRKAASSFPGPEA